MIALQSSTNDFILRMRSDFLNQFEILINNFHSYLSTITGVLVLIFIVYKVILYMVNPEKGLDPFVIIRPCLIMAGIVLYQPLIDLFMIKPMGLLTDIVKQSILNLSGIDITGFDGRFNSSMTRVDDRLYDVLQINPFMELIHLFVYFVGSLIASYMLIKQALSIAIYYFMGYFSLTFSLIPGNERSFLNWALSFLAILLWEPFIMVLKYLIILTRIDTENFSSFFVVVAVQVSAIFLFLKVPRFCELLINGGSPLGAPWGGGGASGFRRISSGLSSIRSMLSKK
ncbi:hypothetical protein OOZ15_18345 [Galbibacter sp. EGI 63066]|uniref:hypothetical protein n=1 Tax=Galbibacter sp. EGI 63066 TaxID=2993559 RepID=UPI002248E47A|nr:hypothetical protein [Galbibacter sp. EGI 63066]MCX2681918.1 hypothetical protein [Galbibacter sp. EGI 63066]